MDHVESIIHRLEGANNIKLWQKYVDDVLVIRVSDENELEAFLGRINRIHNNLKFTMEIESNRKISFLDNAANSKYEIGIY